MENKTDVCAICGKSFLNKTSLEKHFRISKDIKHNHWFFNDTNADEWIECKICNIRKKSIVIHLKEHNLKSEQYKKQFDADVLSKKCKLEFEKFQKEGARNKQRHETRKSHRTFQCSVCPEKFASEQGLKKHIRKVDDIKHSHLIFNDKNLDDWVECNICGCRRAKLDKHIESVHKMSTKEYYEKFNKTIISKNLLDLYKETGRNANIDRDVSGCSNPFFGKHHTDETKKQISLTLLSKRDSEKIKKVFKELNENEKFNNQTETIFEILDVLDEEQQ